MSYPKRTIDELVTRYILEPSLQDIFVEGAFDKDVLNRQLSNVSGDLSIYQIDTVDVPMTVVLAHGLTSGNKQRVIALAKELESNTPEGTSYFCLVDKDLDHWLGRVEVVRGLRWTKYTSIEAHFYADEIIKCLLVDVYKSKISDFKEFKKSLDNCLFEIYLMKLADAELGWSLSWIKLDSSIDFIDSQLKLDADTYLKKVVGKNNRSADKNKIKDKIEALRLKAVGDIRQRIRGHDFVDLLYLTVKKAKGRTSICSVEAIFGNFILLAANVESLREELV